MKILLGAAVFLTPTYLIRFDVMGIPTNMWELLLGAIFLMWLKEDFSKKKLKIWWEDVKKNQYFFPITLILVGTTVSTLAAKDMEASLGIVKGWFVMPLLLALVIAKKIKINKDREWILSAMFLSATIVAVIAITYYMYGYLTYDGRLRAFWESPNHLAMYLAPGSILSFWNVFLKNNKKEKIWKVVLWSGAFALIATSIYLTKSYATWMAIFVSVGVMGYLKHKKNKTALLQGAAVLIFAIGIIFVFQIQQDKFTQLIKFEERSSLSSRIMIWKASTKIIQDNWFFGIGPGNFQASYLEYQKHFPPYLEWAVPQPHNLFLAFWLQSGLVGLVGFLWLLLVWTKSVLKKIKGDANNHIPYFLLGIMVYFLIHGLVDTTYWKNDLAIMFWTVFVLI